MCHLAGAGDGDGGTGVGVGADIDAYIDGGGGRRASSMIGGDLDAYTGTGRLIPVLAPCDPCCVFLEKIGIVGGTREIAMGGAMATLPPSDSKQTHSAGLALQRTQQDTRQGMLVRQSGDLCV